MLSDFVYEAPSPKKAFPNSTKIPMFPSSCSAHHSLGALDVDVCPVRRQTWPHPQASPLLRSLEVTTEDWVAEPDMCSVEFKNLADQSDRRPATIPVRDRRDRAWSSCHRSPNQRTVTPPHSGRLRRGNDDGMVISTPPPSGVCSSRR